MSSPKRQKTVSDDNNVTPETWKDAIEYISIHDDQPPGGSSVREENFFLIHIDNPTRPFERSIVGLVDTVNREILYLDPLAAQIKTPSHIFLGHILSHNNKGGSSQYREIVLEDRRLKAPVLVVSMLFLGILRTSKGRSPSDLFKYLLNLSSKTMPISDPRQPQRRAAVILYKKAVASVLKTMSAQQDKTVDVVCVNDDDGSVQTCHVDRRTQVVSMNIQYLANLLTKCASFSQCRLSLLWDAPELHMNNQNVFWKDGAFGPSHFLSPISNDHPSIEHKTDIPQPSKEEGSIVLMDEEITETVQRFSKSIIERFGMPNVIILASGDTENSFGTKSWCELEQTLRTPPLGVSMDSCWLATLMETMMVPGWWSIVVGILDGSLSVTYKTEWNAPSVAMHIEPGSKLSSVVAKMMLLSPKILSLTLSSGPTAVLRSNDNKTYSYTYNGPLKHAINVTNAVVPFEKLSMDAQWESSLNDYVGSREFVEMIGDSSSKRRRIEWFWVQYQDRLFPFTVSRSELDYKTNFELEPSHCAGEAPSMGGACIDLTVHHLENDATLTVLNGGNACVRFADSGSILLQLVINLVKYLGVRRLLLQDLSSVKCGGSDGDDLKSVSLRLLSVFKTGKPWYAKYGFVPNQEDYGEEKVAEIENSSALLHQGFRLCDIVKEAESTPRNLLTVPNKSILLEMVSKENPNVSLGDFMTRLYQKENCSLYTSMLRLLINSRPYHKAYTAAVNRISMELVFHDKKYSPPPPADEDDEGDDNFF